MESNLKEQGTLLISLARTMGQLSGNGAIDNRLDRLVADLHEIFEAAACAILESSNAWLICRNAYGEKVTHYHNRQFLESLYSAIENNSGASGFVRVNNLENQPTDLMIAEVLVDGKGWGYLIIEKETVALKGMNDMLVLFEQLAQAIGNALFSNQQLENIQKKLDEKTALLELAEDNLELGIWEYRPEKNELRGNRYAFQIYEIEFPVKDASGHLMCKVGREQIERHWTEEEKNKAKGILKTNFTNPKWSNADREIFFPDGRTKFIKGETVFIPKDHQGDLKAVGFILDVTDDKEKEKALSESEKRMRMVVQNLPFLIDAFDNDGNILVWNKACEDTTGYTAEEMIGNKEAIKWLYPDPDYRAKLLSAWKTARSTGGESAEEWELTCKDGSKRIISWTDLEETTPVPGWAAWGIGVDVTEKKIVEKSFKESKQRLERMYFEAPTMLHTTNKKGEITSVSEYWLQVMGYEREDVIGRSELELFTEKSREHAQTTVQPEFHKLGYYTDVHYQYKKKNGFFLEVMQSAILEKNSKGEIEQSLIVTTDITERVKVEKALKESEERFRKVIESSTNAMLLIRNNGKVDFVNKEAENLFGYVEHEWEEILIEDLIPERFRQKHSIVRSEYNTNPFSIMVGDRDNNNLWALTKNNKEVPVEIGLSPVEIKGDVYTLASIVDITQRKEAEEAIKESNRKYSSMVNHVPGIMYSCANDKDWTMEYLSPATEEITGYNPKEFYPPNNKITYSSLILSDDREEVWKTVQAALKEKRPFKIMYRIKTKVGLIRWVWEHGNGVFDDHGNLLNLEGCIFDITEKISAEEMVISAILETEDKERRRISKEIHDGLQQTLTVASLNFEPIKKELELLSETRQKKYAVGWDYLQRAIQESRTVAHSLMPKAIEDFGYTSAIESLINDLNKNVNTKFHFYNNLADNRLPLSVEVSLYRITQEAINNIIKYANAKSATIQLMKYSDMIQLMVEDNGNGFKMDQVNMSESGFGLASMKNRANAISGDLYIDSQPGKGTSIVLEVPLKKINKK